MEFVHCVTLTVLKRMEGGRRLGETPRISSMLCSAKVCNFLSFLYLENREVAYLEVGMVENICQ